MIANFDSKFAISDAMYSIPNGRPSVVSETNVSSGLQRTSSAHNERPDLRPHLQYYSSPRGAGLAAGIVNVTSLSLDMPVSSQRFRHLARRGSQSSILHLAAHVNYP